MKRFIATSIATHLFKQEPPHQTDGHAMLSPSASSLKILHSTSTAVQPAGMPSQTLRSAILFDRNGELKVAVPTTKPDFPPLVDAILL